MLSIIKQHIVHNTGVTQQMYKIIFHYGRDEKQLTGGKSIFVTSI